MNDADIARWEDIRERLGMTYAQLATYATDNFDGADDVVAWARSQAEPAKPKGRRAAGPKETA